MSTDTEMTFPALVAGGIMLSYHCSCACRHCLYRCSPKRANEWITLEMAARIFEALGREPRPPSLHLAGGEPTLRMDLLVGIVQLAAKYRVRLSYVETNASGCTDDASTLRDMRRLRDAGLPAILVSADMFHNEFVPFARTRRCVEAARKVFGAGNTIVYLPHLYDMLERLPEERTHTLDEFCRFAGIEDRPQALLDFYGVIPGGRAVKALRRCYLPRPAEAFKGESCRGELLSTHHFHIDPSGHLFTGLCAGIVVGTVDNFHPAITARCFPVFCRACEEGPYGLMRLAVEEHGFRPREDGYVSKCDLCLDVRGSLEATGHYPELRPATFYAP